ncbi:hypothetical protein [Pelosinus fermentans]|uniref:hypothetical protein n=1 Tax=Pelosinus fermentans TaxID=365349 RepID=UPI003B42AA07
MSIYCNSRRDPDRRPSFAETAVTGKLIVSVKVLAVILTVLAASVLLQSFRHNFRAVFTTQVLGTMIFSLF